MKKRVINRGIILALLLIMFRIVFIMYESYNFNKEKNDIETTVTNYTDEFMNNINNFHNKDANKLNDCLSSYWMPSSEFYPDGTVSLDLFKNQIDALSKNEYADGEVEESKITIKNVEIYNKGLNKARVKFDVDLEYKTLGYCGIIYPFGVLNAKSHMRYLNTDYARNEDKDNSIMAKEQGTRTVLKLHNLNVYLKKSGDEWKIDYCLIDDIMVNVLDKGK
ncbi:MAG: hypothetical protein K6G26_05965 [Lachnospiraceae bacterium]|nr:hypothetical protein [Lachnospiraceae bacterium]